ncbi:MAG TPA: DUF1610 domain-containing protein [Euryarchaeota archaeon]|nr:DUF1610 domain-containing protein [Euryarchaeota archaeon]
MPASGYDYISVELCPGLQRRTELSEKEKICTSCGRRLAEDGGTTFTCPSCGEQEIGRCAICRDQSVVYSCPRCGHSGP